MSTCSRFARMRRAAALAVTIGVAGAGITGCADFSSADASRNPQQAPYLASTVPMATRDLNGQNGPQDELAREIYRPGTSLSVGW